MSNTNLSNQLQVVSLDSRIFGGEAALKFADFGDLADQLPQEVLKPGNALLCNPVTLRPFKNGIKSVQRLLQAHGVKYKAGYLIAIEKQLKDGSVKPILDPVLQQAKLILANLEVLKQEFLAKYEENLDLWIQKVQDEFPEWAAKIRQYAPTASEVDARIWFHLDVEGFGLPVQLASVGDGGLSRRLAGLPMQILKEVSQQAKAWKGKQGGTNVSQFRETMATIRDKLDSLSMLDTSGYVAKASELCDELLTRLPYTGKLDNTDYFLARSLMDKFIKPEEFFNEDLDNLTFDKLEINEIEYMEEEMQKESERLGRSTPDLQNQSPQSNENQTYPGESVSSASIDEILEAAKNSAEEVELSVDMLDF